MTGNPFRIVARCEAAFDSRAKGGDDIACAPDHLREVDFHRRNAKAEIGSPAGKMRDAGGRDGGLGRCAAEIDARSTQVFALDQRCTFSG